MEETRMIENDYVPRELFDVHIQGLRDRANSDKELSDEKFEKLQMILEKNLAEYKVMITEVNSKISLLDGKIDKEESTLNEKLDHVHDTLNERINRVESTLDEKIEHTTDTLVTAITDLDKRIDDIHHSHTVWFTIFGLLAVVMPIAVVVAEHFLK